MFVFANILGIFVFIAIAALFSRDRKNIQWKSVGIVLALEILLAWCLVFYSIQGRTNRCASCS